MRGNKNPHTMAGGNVKWCSGCGKQFEVPQKVTWSTIQSGSSVLIGELETYVYTNIYSSIYNSQEVETTQVSIN